MDPYLEMAMWFISFTMPLLIIILIIHCFDRKSVVKENKKLKKKLNKFAISGGSE